MAVLGCIVFAILCIVILDSTLNPEKAKPKDDTDPAIGRSGLNLYTDAKTGIQYLGMPRGGLTVRFKNDGTPMTIRD